MKVTNFETLYLRQPESGRAPTAGRTRSPKGEDAIGVLMTTLYRTVTGHR